MSEIKTEEQYNDRSDSYEEGAEHYMGEVVVDGLVWGLKNAFYMASYLIGSLTEEMKKNEQGAFKEIEEQQAVIAYETPLGHVPGHKLVEDTGHELAKDTEHEIAEEQEKLQQLTEEEKQLSQQLENTGHQLATKKNQLTQELAKEQENLQQLQEEEKQLSQQLEKTGHELAAKKNKLTQEIAERQKNLQLIKEKEGQLNAQLEKLNGTLSENQGAQSTLTQKYTENEERSALIKTQIIEGKKTLDALDAAIEKAQSKVVAVNIIHEANRRKADSLSGRVRDFFVSGLNVLVRGWNTVVKSVGAGYLSVSEVSLYSDLAKESFNSKKSIDEDFASLEGQKALEKNTWRFNNDQAQSLAKAMEEVQALKAEEESLNTTKAEVDASLVTLSSAIKDKEQKISEKQNEIQALDEQFNTRKAEVATSLEALSLAIKDIKQKISEKQKEIQALDPQLEVPKPAVQATLQENRSDNKDAKAQTGVNYFMDSTKARDQLARGLGGIRRQMDTSGDDDDDTEYEPRKRS